MLVTLVAAIASIVLVGGEYTPYLFDRISGQELVDENGPAKLTRIDGIGVDLAMRCERELVHSDPGRAISLHGLVMDITYRESSIRVDLETLPTYSDYEGRVPTEGWTALTYSCEFEPVGQGIGYRLTSAG